MDLAKTFTTLLGMVTLKNQSFREAGKKDFVTALMNFFLASTAVGIGAFLLTFDVFSLFGTIIGGTIGLTIAYFVGVFIFWGLAKLFGGKAQYMQHYTGASYLALLAIPSIIPFVGQVISALLGLWGIVMHIFLVKEIHKLSPVHATIAVLIPYMVLAILAVAIVALAVFLFAGTMSFAALSAL